ncbi:MAG: helix-turn-helix domain containing protein [Nevskia sp.]|nr:helix-turn-helix domain containing protein [Nevskia sp.]
MTMRSSGPEAGAPLEAAVPRVGRPPSISTEAIVDVAIEIGLDKVSFRQIAERLGVNVATVYRYVRNRNELLRLAAFRLTLSRRLPARAHAHWSQLATRYAEEMFESLLAEPELVSALLKGSIGAHLEMDVLEQFLAAMGRYGFPPEEALQLHRAIGTLAIGAATGVIAVRARQAAGIPWHVEIRRTLIERAEDDLPNVRRAMAPYLEYDEWHWLAPLRQLLAGIAATRGEQLPPPEECPARAAKTPARRPNEVSAAETAQRSNR